MKSFAILVLGVLLGVAVMLAVPHGASKIVLAGSPSGNGDVNGSGKIDIADAIYLLAYLFAKGPEPEAIACDTCCLPCPPLGGLPATGQTRCYNAAGEEIPCEQPDFPGQDGYYRRGCPMANRFVDGGDGTVTDTCTGLMWQKETAVPVTEDFRDGYMPAADGAVDWQHALQYCENLSLAGHVDWRLPNVRELQSIVDSGMWNPSADPIFSVKSGPHWSSSSSVALPDVAWYVMSYDGSVSGGHKNGVVYVRSVRDAR